ATPKALASAAGVDRGSPSFVTMGATIPRPCSNLRGLRGGRHRKDWRRVAIVPTAQLQLSGGSLGGGAIGSGAVLKAVEACPLASGALILDATSSEEPHAFLQQLAALRRVAARLLPVRAGY